MVLIFIAVIDMVVNNFVIVDKVVTVINNNNVNKCFRVSYISSTNI